jgi:hypothetical protein
MGRTGPKLMSLASHHYHMLLLDGKLFLAPIPEDVKVGSPFSLLSYLDYCLVALQLILASPSLMWVPVPVRVFPPVLTSK